MKRIIFNGCCVAVILFSGWKLYEYFSTYQKVEQLEDEIVNQSDRDPYFNLRHQYNEMIGWITIAGTRIDYPIMQTANNEFYLTHNYKGEKLRAGSIFLDFRNDPNFHDRHSIIYGHDMRNDSMFGQLNKYADEEFAMNHEMIHLIVDDEMLTLEVFAAYQTTTEFYYIETEFTDSSFEQFLNEIQNKSFINFGRAVDLNDQLVTLSTCTSSVNDDERFVVHAKIVERKDVTHEETNAS